MSSNITPSPLGSYDSRHPLGQTDFVRTHGINVAVAKVLAHSNRIHGKRPTPGAWRVKDAGGAPEVRPESGTGPREVLTSPHTGMVTTIADIARRAAQ